MKYAAIFFFFALATLNAAAQSMVEVDMTGQPLQYSKGGNTDGCGIRIVGVLPLGTFEISSDNPNVKTVDVLDGSRPVSVKGRVVWVWNGRKL